MNEKPAAHRFCVPAVTVFLFAHFLLNSQAVVGQKKPASGTYSPGFDNAPLEMTVQTRHSDYVVDLEFSQDGEFMFSAGDQSVKIWGMDGALIRTIDLPARIQDVCISNNGRYVAVMHGYKVSLFDPLGKNIWGPMDAGSAESVGFSDDDQFLVTGANDRKPDSTAYDFVRWDLEGKIVTRLVSDLKSISKCLILPGQNRFVITDKSLRFFDFEGKLIKRVDEEPCIVSTSRNGRIVAIGTRAPGRILVYDANGEPLSEFEVSANDVGNVDVSPDGQQILTKAGAQVSIWSVTGKLLHSFEENHNFNVWFGPNAESVISSSHVGDLSQLDLAGNELTRFGNLECLVPLEIQWSPDEQVFAAFCERQIVDYAEKILTIWSIDGRILKTIREAEGMAFGPASGLFLENSDGLTRLWDLKSMSVVATVDTWTPDAISFSDDGTEFAVGGGSPSSGWLKIFEIDGKPVFESDAFQGAIRSIRFSRSRNLLLVRTLQKILMMELNGNIAGSFELGGSYYRNNAMTLSPDGSHFAFADSYSFTVCGSDGTTRTIVNHDYDTGDIESLEFRNDSRSLFVFSNGYEADFVTEYDLDGKILRRDTLDAICYSPGKNGDKGLAGRPDGSIRIVYRDKQEHVNYFTNGSDWIVYSDNGYFDSSPHGGSLLRMVKGFHVRSVDQFAARYNRPDLLLSGIDYPDQSLINHYQYCFEKRLTRMSLEKSGLDRDLHVPEVSELTVIQNDKWVDVSFEMTDTKYQITSYNVYLNDVPVYGASGKPALSGAKDVIETIELTTGRNKIEVSCTNEKGVESLRSLGFAEYLKPASQDLYFIGFGVSSYKNQSLNLAYPAKDVNDLAVRFRYMTKHFENVYTQTFLDEQVTLKNIEKCKSLLAASKPDDLLILFVAGHGVYSVGTDGTYYYLTHDTDLNDLESTAADFEIIENILQGIPPRKKLFLMDTCESGEIDDDVRSTYYALAENLGIKARSTRGVSMSVKKGKEGKKKPGRNYLYEKDRFIYNDLIRRSGAIVFSSSRGGEFSYESDEIENGYFTEEILNALSGNADVDSDGLVSISELKNFVSLEVAKKTGQKQNPTVDRDNIFQVLSLPVTPDYNELGKAAWFAGDLEGAISHFKTMTELNPDDFRGWHNVGRCYLSRGEYENALPVLTTASDLAPNDFRVWNSLGEYLLAVGRYEESLGLFKKSIDLKATDFAWYNMARAEYLLKDLDAAKAALEKALQLAPDNTHLQGMLKQLNDEIENR